MATGIVYKLTNMLNGKVYVGKTRVGLPTRWSQHKYTARNQAKTYLHRAMRKYGEENFFVEILESGLSQRDLNLKETEWINKLESWNPKKGYNATFGGDGGNHQVAPWAKKTPSKDLIQRRNSSLRKNWAERSPERRKEVAEKISNAWTPEKREVNSQQVSEFWQSGRAAEAREKIRKALSVLRTCSYCGQEFNGRQWQKHSRSKCPQGHLWPVVVKPKRVRIGSWKGKKVPAEIVAKRAEAIRAVWTPEKRTAWGIRMAERWTANARAAHSETLKKRPLDREAWSRKMKENFSLEARAKCSQASKRYWAARRAQKVEV